jgi:outer membrane lipoprotein carrier protein
MSFPFFFASRVLNTLAVGFAFASAAISPAGARAQATPEVAASGALMPASAASSLQALERFVTEVRSGRASFTQVVTAPTREGQLARSKTSSGTFEFLRPNRFRFFYQKPFEQLIVADGQNLWLHDRDLNQVTVRNLSQVLSGTPAAVISAAPDLKVLQADFKLSVLPAAEGLQWIQAEPKAREGQVQRIQVGFRITPRGSELAALDILDSFGQRSRISFSAFEANLPLAASYFQFKPPAGADLIRP